MFFEALFGSRICGEICRDKIKIKVIFLHKLKLINGPNKALMMVFVSMFLANAYAVFVYLTYVFLCALILWFS